MSHRIRQLESHLGTRLFGRGDFTLTAEGAAYLVSRARRTGRVPENAAQFNDLGLVYDAAASSFGVALVRLQMGAAWLESGRLVRLSPRATPSPHGRYICWQPGVLERWECAAFADWLTQALT